MYHLPSWNGYWDKHNYISLLNTMLIKWQLQRRNYYFICQHFSHINDKWSSYVDSSSTVIRIHLNTQTMWSCSFKLFTFFVCLQSAKALDVLGILPVFHAPRTLLSFQQQVEEDDEEEEKLTDRTRLLFHDRPLEVALQWNWDYFFTACVLWLMEHILLTLLPLRPTMKWGPSTHYHHAIIKYYYSARYNGGFRLQKYFLSKINSIRDYAFFKPLVKGLKWSCCSNIYWTWKENKEIVSSDHWLYATRVCYIEECTQ